MEALVPTDERTASASSTTISASLDRDTNASVAFSTVLTEHSFDVSDGDENAVVSLTSDGSAAHHILAQLHEQNAELLRRVSDLEHLQHNSARNSAGGAMVSPSTISYLRPDDAVENTAASAAAGPVGALASGVNLTPRSSLYGTAGGKGISAVAAEILRSLVSSPATSPRGSQGNVVLFATEAGQGDALVEADEFAVLIARLAEADNPRQREDLVMTAARSFSVSCRQLGRVFAVLKYPSERLSAAVAMGRRLVDAENARVVLGPLLCTESSAMRELILDALARAADGSAHR